MLPIFSKNISKIFLSLVIITAVFCITASFFVLAWRARAVDGNVLDGITVDSTLDTPDISIGDGSCNDGAGNCTLRAAIEEANSDPDASSIDFNIAGAGVKTFLPATPLPTITQTLVIDGYTQPGASPNTAVSPRPFNGSLQIVIDGSSSLAAGSNGITINADNVVVRGLVVNSFNFDGFNASGSNNTIAGNYIGTDQTGLLDKGNTQRGIGNGPAAGDNLVIGGLEPEDRNIVSGNDGPGISPNAGHTSWKVWGNYVGLASDGLSSVANSSYGGAGGLSIDNDNNHVIGGSAVGSGNVISGNNSFGIFPDNTDNLTIQGNIIGPDWKGDPLVINPQLGGIGLPPLAGPITNLLIGGVSPGQGNLIAFNKGTAVAVLSATSSGAALYNSTDVAVLGNSIYGNTTEGSFPLSQSALGIDLLSVNLPEYTITNSGPTLNDAADVDLGPNYYMNFPVISSAVQNGAELTVVFSLDAANSTQGGLYRIEFFVNDSSDISGYGQGQKYLGYSDSSNGTAKQASLSLDTGTNLSGKVLSATTTALSSTSASGFGSTSEFAKDQPITVFAPALPPRGARLANTSNSSLAIAVLLVYVLLLEAALVARQAQYLGGYKNLFKLARASLKAKLKLS